jgi:hypothetical protein
MPLVKCVECAFHDVRGSIGICQRHPTEVHPMPYRTGCGDGERRVSDADARDLREAQK